MARSKRRNGQVSGFDHVAVNGRHYNGKSRNKDNRSRRIRAADVTNLASLQEFLGIQPDQWDAIIVGDGSGTSWEKEMGFASVLVRNNTFERQVFYGGHNVGTNNVAEIMAIFWPLFYLANTGDGITDRGYRVHVVTDSDYVVNGLKSRDPIHDKKLRANRELWLAIHAVQRRGIRIFPHHIHRDTIALNKLGHDIANAARKSQIKIMEKSSWDIYSANPI